ncbi:MAG: hypothetical protein ABIE74_07015 [Pseudomonadota bacterium]
MKKMIRHLLILAIISLIPALVWAEAVTDEQNLSGKCRVAKVPAKIICKKGGDPLCVNTPPGSVTQDYLLLSGFVDRSNPLGSLRVSVQNDYTKASEVFYLSSYENAVESCDAASLKKDGAFCIDDDGKYLVRVPLKEMGPYTMDVSATRVQGSDSKKAVRTSRVVAPEVKKIEFSPSIDGKEAIKGTHVDVVLSLLDEDCHNCDFIGASTGGVEVTVSNTITDEKGNSRSVSCSADVASEGEGKFRVGTPILEGKNKFRIKVCNAANEKNCKQYKEIEFTVGGKSDGFRIITPPPAAIYDSNSYPEIPLSFSWGELSKDEIINIRLNTLEPIKVEAGTDGIYRKNIVPQFGVNIVTIESSESSMESKSLVFGWGSVNAISSKGDNLAFSIKADTFENKILPKLNSYLANGKWREFLKKLVDLKMKGASGSEIIVSTEPKIGSVRMEDVKFGADEFSFSLNIDDLSVFIDIAGNGLEAIPLLLSFAKIKIDLTFQQSVNGEEISYRLSSPHTDCDYIERAYCKSTFAPIIPQNFAGNANPIGGFLACKAPSGRTLSSDIEKFCNNFNSIDAQTALLSETILEIINSTISGDKIKDSLTAFFNKGVEAELEYGCEDGRTDCSFLQKQVGNLKIPYMLSFKKGLSFSTNGLTLGAGIAFNKDGKIVSSPDEALDYKIPALADIRLELLTNLINRMFYILSQGEPGHAPLDFKIDREFFKSMGFDTLEKCKTDASKEPEMLCKIRPRVTEFLGSGLSNYEYFDNYYPIQIRIQPLRQLPPMMFLKGANQLQLQLGGMKVYFYALDVDKDAGKDEYGNWKEIKKDKDGKPLILNLRPDQSDPTKGQIITAELNFLLNVVVDGLSTDPSDPSNAVIRLKIGTNTGESPFRLELRAVAGSNSTTVPDDDLISSIRQTISLVLNTYADPNNPKIISIPLPKGFDLSSYSDQFEALGLKKLDLDLEKTRLEFIPDDGLIFLDVGILGF